MGGAGLARYRGLDARRSMKPTLYSSIFAATALISALVASIAWQRRSIRGGRPLALMMVAVTEWALMAALEAAAVELPTKILLSKLEYVGSTSATVFLLVFALEYTRHDEWLTPRNIALLWIVPILNMGLAATNEWHKLVWTGFSPGRDGTNLLIYHHGPGFWFVMASVYVYLSVAALLLFRAALRPSALHRRQGAALLLASVAPWVGSIIYTLDMSPIPGLDIIPLTFTLTGLVLIWGILRVHLLDLVPVARDTLIEHMSDGVLVLDAQDRIVDINPSAQQLLAGGDSSLIGRPVGQVLDTWPGIALQAERGQASEVILDKDRTEPRFMDVRVSRVFDREHVHIGHLVVLRDVTERKQAETALQELNATLEARVAARTADARAEKEKVEAILRSVGDAIILADLEMQIQYVNRAFTTLTGYSADEVLGRPIAAAGVGVASEQVLESITSALSQGNTWHGEVEGQTKDGRTFDAVLTVAPVYGADRQIEGCVSSLLDISPQRELERARTRFMTNVSHELRTPVTSIKLHLHLLKQERRQDMIEQHHHMLTEETTRLEHLILDILELARLDSGRGTREWQPVSLSGVIEDVVTRYGQQAEAADLTLRAQPAPPDLPLVTGDRDQLLRALEEVVENAVAFTPAGGQVSVEAGTVEEDDHLWVTVAVRDTGTGISTDDQRQIFDRFHRGHVAEPGHISGAGLGLSIAEGIMRFHGGRITVKSEIGQGSTFTLWLRGSGETAGSGQN